MAGFTGDGYRIELRWKEEVIYWEGDRGFLFDAGWGVEPPVLYVPSEAIWAEVMPDWLQTRRKEVIERLREHTNTSCRKTCTATTGLILSAVS